MSKTAKMLLSVFLIYTMAIGFSPSAAAAPSSDILKIGLFYSSTALPTANLENSVGSGYEFGYFDSNRHFVALGYTDETEITMMKDHNIYLSGGSYYDVEPLGNYSTIGCYHIRLNDTYKNFDAAWRAADGISGASAFPAYYSGTFYVCVGSYATQGDAARALSSLGLSGEVMTASSRCITVVATGTTDILFEYDAEGSGGKDAFGVMPISPREKAETWLKGYTYFGGFQYSRLNSEDMTVVNYVELEDYVKGVIPYEMNASWPIEALKAQAICARNYSQNNIDKHKGYGFDMCNTVDCQVYRGTGSGSANSDAAVDRTAGEYAWYGSELAALFYHSSDGGATEDVQNIWGSTNHPYLKGIYDTFEQYVDTGYESWSFTYTLSEITWILQSKGYPCGDIISVSSKQTDMGNMHSMTFTDNKGINYTFTGENARNILYSSTLKKYTYSQRFTIGPADGSDGGVYVNSSGGTLDGKLSDAYAIGSGGTGAIGGLNNVSVITGSGVDTISGSSTSGSPSPGSNSGVYIVKGSGWGHNVGMSQFGALAMAERGYSYEEILKFYFTQIRIK